MPENLESPGLQLELCKSLTLLYSNFLLCLDQQSSLGDLCERNEFFHFGARHGVVDRRL